MSIFVSTARFGAFIRPITSIFGLHLAVSPGHCTPMFTGRGMTGVDFFAKIGII